MDLEPSANVALAPQDLRPLIPEPLPVKLVTVEDARLMAAAGLEINLDEFYVGLLRFERDAAEAGIVYRAENFRLRFEVTEISPDRDSLRPLMIQVPLLREIENQFIERQLEYTRQRGLVPGDDRLVLRDPAGNWIEISEFRLI